MGCSCEKAYMLFLFTFIGASQCMNWYLFACAPDLVAVYYNLTSREADGFVDLTLNWGAIVICVVFLPTTWALSLRGGLRRSIRLSAFLTWACCVLRMIPCFVARQHRPPLLWLNHVGQILNAACGATFICAVTQFAAVWSDPRDRTQTTGVAYSGANWGMVMGYLIGLLTAGKGHGEVWSYILGGEAAVSSAVVLAVVARCPNAPAALVVEEGARAPATPLLGAGGVIAPLPNPPPPSPPGNETLRFFRDVGTAVTNKAVLLLVLVAGLAAGANAAWGALLPQIFVPLFQARATSDANVCGLWNVLGSLSGNIGAGLLASHVTSLRRRLKFMALLAFAGTTVANAFFTMLFPAPFVPTPGNGSSLDGNRSGANEWALGGDGILLRPADPYAAVSILIFVAGVFQGMLDPLLFELGAELSHPAKEGVSAGLLTLVYNATALVVLTITPNISIDWMNTVYFGTMALAGLLMVGVPVQYNRLDAEAAAGRGEGGHRIGLQRGP